MTEANRLRNSKAKSPFSFFIRINGSRDIEKPINRPMRRADSALTSTLERQGFSPTPASLHEASNSSILFFRQLVNGSSQRKTVKDFSLRNCTSYTSYGPWTWLAWLGIILHYKLPCHWYVGSGKLLSNSSWSVFVDKTSNLHWDQFSSTR